MLEYLTPYRKQCDIAKLKNILGPRQKWFERPTATKYQQIINSLPTIEKIDLDLSHSCPQITSPTISNAEQELIKKLAQQLIPWRKGPFKLFDIEIDAEWRSDKKWQRISPYLDDLTNKTVLDIGCNNGYFLFQMAKFNPQLLLGIDPMPHYQTQFNFINHFARLPNTYFELLGIEHLSAFKNMFDTIFSMGIIYHHRHPIEQLLNIREALKPGGQLILETIGIPGEQDMALFPADRYAKMKNVWFVPTLSCFKNWCVRSKFVDVEIIADTPLTPEEQRLTPWCPPPHQSLADFLDPNDHSKTIEGYPAPRRFALVARKKQC